MNISEQQKKGQELLQTLITKAWEDANFKERLIANPKEEIERIIGKSLSDDKDVLVVDQSNPDHVYINIPAKPDFDNLELTEDQLEAIAGGSQDPFSWGLENIGLPIARWILQ